MDITAFSVFGFSVILVILWGVLILWALSLVARFVGTAMKDAENGEIDRNAWRKHRRSAIVFAIYALFVIFYTNHESAYRPKTVITNPAQHQLREEMRKIYEAPAPIIKPSAPLTPMDGNARKALEENNFLNAKAREEFMRLPE